MLTSMRPLASTGGAAQNSSIAGSAAGSASARVDLTALPSSLRSLLDPLSVAFLRELWRVLRRDEPQTAQALLHPHANDSLTLPPEAAAATPLSVARCDAVAEALGSSLACRPSLSPSAPARWDMGRVNSWVEAHVTAVQGFADQVVIDAVRRSIHSLVVGDNARNVLVGLESRLGLLIEVDVEAWLDELLNFLNSASARAEPPTNGLDATAAAAQAGLRRPKGAGGELGALPDVVESWCQPDVGPPRVLLLTGVSKGVLLLLHSPTERGMALLQLPGQRGLTPVPAVPPSSISPLRGAWAAPGGAVLHVGDRIVRLTCGGGGVAGKLTDVATLPPAACSVAASWPVNGRLSLLSIHEVPLPTPAALPSTAARIQVWSKVQAWTPTGPRTRMRELCSFTPSGGWVVKGPVGEHACRLTLSPDGQRAAWCEVAPGSRFCRPHAHRQSEASSTVDDDFADSRASGGGGEGAAASIGARLAQGTPGLIAGVPHVRGEFWVADLSDKVKFERRALTAGAALVVSISIAPDGTGVAYLATHGAGDASRLGLWWQVWEGGQPPVLLCASTLVGRLLSYGWAPPAEDEEHVTENENGEEESEILPGLRLWVTTLRAGGRPFTQLIDLQGAVLGAFELPITQDAVLWLDDGRRLLITESLEWFPALWDGAALSALPLPPGLSHLSSTPIPWLAADGRSMTALAVALKSTPADAPLLLQLCDERDAAPLIATRAAAAAFARPLLPLLRLGYRVLQVACDLSDPWYSGKLRTGGQRPVASACVARSLVADVVVVRPSTSPGPSTGPGPHPLVPTPNAAPRPHSIAPSPPEPPNSPPQLPTASPALPCPALP